MAHHGSQSTLKFYFDRKNYFSRFLTEENFDLTKIFQNEQIRSLQNSISRNVRHALEYFVNDLRADRNQTIERFLRETSLNEILKSIGILLLSVDDRICGNSAFILGSLVETEIGLKKFLDVFASNPEQKTVNIVRILCQLLTHPDSECTLNAAGTLGTICSSKEGRDLLLGHSAIGDLISNAAALLPSKNFWIASNAALVLARITVEDFGCQIVLNHSNFQDVIEQLIAALKIDDPSRSTNAAFAVGRLIESDEGKNVFLSVCPIDKLFDALSLMLEADEETGVNKNACYALSCLCTTDFGFQLCLQSMPMFHRLLLAVERILLSKEQETVWFALMCLRTISQYDGAPEQLCHSNNLADILKQIRKTWFKHGDILDEAKALWYIIHRHVRPNKPNIEDCRSNAVKFSWQLNVVCWNDNDLQFRIILNKTNIGLTKDRIYVIQDLKAGTEYSLQIQYVTAYGDGLCSEPLTFRTDDELPPLINNLQVVRTSMTAARLTWEPPQFGGIDSLKGYLIFLNEAEHDFVTDCSVTLSSLSASTTYQVDICAVTHKGKGPVSTVVVTTASAGDSLPPPPSFSVIGRREIHVKWQPPESICGRLTRYELVCNGRCIYSGTDQEHRATMLKSDTDYSMEVIVITNEGRFRSRPAKTRTLKDEYSNSHRHSLYESPSPHLSRLKRNETFHFANTISTTNSILPKVLISAERRPSRETNTTMNRSVDITTIRSLQLKAEKTETNAHPRITQSPKRAALIRSNTTATSFVYRRTKTEVGLPNTTKLSAAVITPTLDFDREPTVRWATPLGRQNLSRAKSYRLSALPNNSTISSATHETNHCNSSSLPDFCIN